MVPLVGLLFVVASAFSFWKLLPVNGEIHWLARAPVLESIIPIGVVAGIAMGGAMVLSALAR